MDAHKKPKNIMIPFELFEQIIHVLELLDVSHCAPFIQYEHEQVLAALLAKQDKLDLRDAYAKVIFAENDDLRALRRQQYVNLKNFNNS